jgi:hypothetical protein
MRDESILGDVATIVLGLIASVLFLGLIMTAPMVFGG